MKWDVLILAVALFAVLPMAGFLVARRARGRRRGGWLLAALGLFAVAVPAFLRGEALGFFGGFEETMLGVACVALGHLVLAGLADGWIAARPVPVPMPMRYAISGGLVLIAYAGLFLWPWVE